MERTFDRMRDAPPKPGPTCNVPRSSSSCLFVPPKMAPYVQSGFSGQLMLCANGQSLMYTSADKEFEEEDGGLINAVHRSKFQPRQTEGEDVEPVDTRRPKGYRTSLQGERKFGRTKVNEYATDSECPFTWTNPTHSVSQGHVPFLSYPSQVS